MNWGKFTFYQMACILMLIVAVPFFIALIIVYLVYGLGHHNSGSCGVLCCYLQGGFESFSKTPDSIIHVNDDLFIPEENSSPTSLPVRSLDFPMKEQVLTETRHSSVAALLERLYEDDGKDVVFKCPLAIIDPQWALTVDDCVSGGNLSIRLGSKHWSRGGVATNVKEVVRFGKVTKPSLVLVRFEAAEVVPVEVTRMANIFIRSYSWVHSFNMPLEQRMKFDRLKSVSVEFLQKDDCWQYKKPKHVSCYITRRSGHCGTINAPMIDSYNHLVGLHLETLCEKKKKFSVVFYINLFEYNVALNAVI